MNKWLFIKDKNHILNYNLNIKKINENLYITESDRFSNDSVLINDENCISFLSGIILNKKDLEAKYKNLKNILSYNNWIKSNVIPAYHLNGVFSGGFYNKQNGDIYIFENQVGNGFVFYFYNNNIFIASNEFNYIYDLCKSNSIKLHFNEKGAKQLLSLGFMVDDNTIISEIKRLKPGEYVKLSNNIIELKEYFKFEHNIINCSEEEAVEKIDYAFQIAVDRCFQKDIEYGYKHHLINMSGGFDCRMISYVGKKLGYNNITNNTYAKYGSDEAKRASMAAKDLHNDFLFFQLDSMNNTYDLDDIIKSNYGLSMYTASKGCNRMLSNINFHKFGLEFTGVVGGGIINSYVKQGEKDSDISIENLGLINIYKPKIESIIKFNSKELFWLYIRGFQGMMQSFLVRRKYTISVSPFLDIDFINTCLSIPIEMRMDHKIYWKWIKTKYPEILKISGTEFNKKYCIKGIVKKILGTHKMSFVNFLRKYKLLDLFLGSNQYNPQDLMIKKNSDVLKFMNNTFNSRINLLYKHKEIYEMCKNMYSFNMDSKYVVLTLLSAYYQYIGSEDE